MANTMTINLDLVIPSEDTSLIGREKGEIFSSKLSSLNGLEEFYDKVEIIIPDRIITMNGSFFSGFFGSKVKKLGKEAFLDKYDFKADNHILKRINKYIDQVLLEVSTKKE